ERSDAPRNVIAAGHDGHPEPPAVAVPEAGDETRRRLLLGRQLIGRHELDRRSGQDAFAAVYALVQHHLTKGEVVVDGRDQSSGASLERGRAAPLAAIGLVIELERARFLIRRVTRRQPVERGSGDAEATVLHPEWLEDA